MFATSYHKSPIELSILFIPFDAAKSHYRRNAENGTDGYWRNQMGTDLRASHLGFSMTEASGSVMSPAEISLRLPEIVESVCDQTKGGVVPTISWDQQMAINQRKDVIESARRIEYPARTYPSVIFLSEQPKDVDFPDIITLPVSGINYYQMPVSTGSRRVQRIYAYVREDETYNGGTWDAESTTKYSGGGKVEHILLVQYVFGDITCRFVGVHLSAENTGYSFAKQSREVENLKDFCKRHNIHFAIGDFNIDMNKHGGDVGAKYDSTCYLAPSFEAENEMLFQEQYTSSNNKKHYMGHLITAPGKVALTGMDATGSFGLSGARSLSGSYYSDHAPIFVKLAFIG